MKRNGFFPLLIAIMMITTVIPFFVDAGTSTETDADIQVPEVEQTPSGLLEPDQPFIDLNELMEAGVGDFRTIDIDDIDNIPASLYDTSRIPRSSMRTMTDSIMAEEEADDIDNPFYAYDDDEISNNVTSTISGTTITFDDEDFYQVNLTSDGINSTVDRLEITVTSTDAVDQNASLTVEILQVDYLFGQWIDGGFESVGKFHGSSKTIVIVPEGDLTLNLEIPIMLRFRSWNSTSLNYSFKIDITSTTRTEWNGFFGVGPIYNSTNAPPKMQSINRSHDLFDWFDLSGAITDTNLDIDRGDEIRFGLSVDVATEERGTMFNPYGLYGTQSPTTTLMVIYLVWLNYTSQQLGIYTPGDSLPAAAALFNMDPVTINYRTQADHLWIGMRPVSYWGDTQSGRYYPGAEGNAEMFYNITSISADLIPPNKAPTFSLPIEDQDFEEDEGPWYVTDLLTHFSDEDTITPLEFKVTKPSGVTNPDELEVTIKDGRYLWVNVTEPNWYGEGEYKVRCYDYGVLDASISIDDREAISNTFEIVVNPVNDDAYIEKVDAPVGGAIPNDHEPILISFQQGRNIYRDKKIYGGDNDTEDLTRLVYTHNATTPAFTMNKNGQVSFLPTNDDVGTTYVRIWVDDQKGRDEDDYADLMFVITNKNDKPELVEIEWSLKGASFDLTTEDNPTFRNVREDSEINLTVTASDPDILIGQADLLTWSVGGQGWEVHPHPTDPLKAYVTYTPTNDDSIATMVETSLFCMDAANSMSQDITIRLTIENRNDAPEILTVNNEIPVKDGSVRKIFLTQETGQYALEDSLFYIYVTAQDIDPKDSITFEAREASGVVDTSFQFFQDPLDDFAGNFTIRPNQDMVGFHTVVITVLDEDEEADSVIVQYEVVNTNDPPGDFRVDWGTSVDLVVGNNITFFVEDLNDPDGDDLTVTWDFGDNTGTVTGENVVHSYKKDQSYIITVTVADPSGLKEQITRTITIYPKEEPEPDPDLDSDGDGMPDVYEDDNGLNKNINDAGLDNDKDGFTNLDEYQKDTNPLDPKSHPVKSGGDDGNSDLLLIIVILIVVILVIAALGFFLFVAMRKPKPVVQQMAYAPETGLPPGGQQGLPGQAMQGLPPGPDQENVSGGGIPQGLPPAPEPEDEFPDSFLEDAAETLRQEKPAEDDADKNIWRPPVEEDADSQGSQVDDLFADAPEEEPPEPKATNLPPPPPDL